MDVAHLTYREKTNLGSFYTPSEFVEIAYAMLARFAGTCDVVLDSSCGYGAFFSVPFPFPVPRLVGGDIDVAALRVARERIRNAEFFCANALADISREKYGISSRERLIIVGNPPYNDVTSRVKNALKSDLPEEIDADVRTRDLGISFLLSFAKLRPDFVVVLHPLSYLIKEANFRLLAPFMRNFALRDALVFNSQEFSDTSKCSGFPIVIAVYERSVAGTAYADVVRRRFKTKEGPDFSLSDFDYVCRYIPKYPARSRRFSNPPSRYKFFTMRDINALKRSRTFISEDTANAVAVPRGKLELYCYVDVFKDFAAGLPYYFGNFDVMIDRAAFEYVKNDFLALSIEKHPEIFSEEFPPLSRERVSVARQRVGAYFRNLFNLSDDNV